MENELYKIRNKLIDSALIGLISFNIPALAFSILRSTQTGWIWIYSVHIVIALIFVCIFVFRKKLSLGLKTHFLAIIFLLIAFLGTIKFGVSGGYYTCIIAILISLLIFGKRTGIIYSAISITGLSIIGVLQLNHNITRNIDFNVYNYNSTTWLGLIFVLSFNIIIIIFSIGLFHKLFSENIKSLIIKSKEQEEIQEALSFSETRYKLLVDNAFFAVMVATFEGEILFINQYAENFFGHKKDYLVQKGITSFWVNPQKRKELVEELKSTQRVQNKEVEIFTNENRIKTILLSASMIDYQGQQAIFSISNDITERKKSETELLESQKFINLIAEQSLDIIFVFHIAQNKNIYINKNLREILNYKKGDMPEDSIELIEKLIHPDDLDQFLTYEDFVKDWDREYVHQYEYRLKDANGQWRWFYGREKEFQREDNKIVTVIGVVTDVTQRKRAENDLIEAKVRAETNERRFELAVKGSTHGIWDWNLIKNETYYSPRWKELIGYQDNELPDSFSSFENNIHPDDKESVFEMLNGYLNKKIIKFEVEFRFLHKKGHYVWIRSRGEALRDEKGKAIRMSGSHSDITDAKLAEEALKKSESKLSTALDIALLGYWEYDLLTDTFTLNDHFYKIFQTSVEKIGSYQLSSNAFAQQFLFPDDRQKLISEIQNINRFDNSKTNLKLEQCMMFADGSAGYISVEFYLVKDKNGKTSSFYGVTQNITQRKQSEEKLKLQMDELKRWNNVTKGRENRILELKNEINQILQSNGLPKKYIEQ